MCQEGIPSLKGPLNELLTKIVLHDKKIESALMSLKVIDLKGWKEMRKKRKELVSELQKGAKR